MQSHQSALSGNAKCFTVKDNTASEEIRHWRWWFWPHFDILWLLIRTGLFYSSSVLSEQLKEPLTNAVQLLRDLKLSTWREIRCAWLTVEEVIVFVLRWHEMLVVSRLTFSQVLVQNTWLGTGFVSLPSPCCRCKSQDIKISPYLSALANVLIIFIDVETPS